MTGYLRDPKEIYARSFDIIKAEADFSGLPVDAIAIATWVIHACGMPEIARDLRISADFRSAALGASSHLAAARCSVCRRRRRCCCRVRCGRRACFVGAGARGDRCTALERRRHSSCEARSQAAGASAPAAEGPSLTVAAAPPPIVVDEPQPKGQQRPQGKPSARLSTDARRDLGYLSSSCTDKVSCAGPLLLWSRKKLSVADAAQIADSAKDCAKKCRLK